MAKFEGKAALVTGGSRGIGRATALALAEGGADVALTYGSSRGEAEAVAAEIEAFGRRSVAIQADASDPANAAAAVRSAKESFGRLDILVNNAGVFLTGGPEDLDDAALSRQWNVNVHAVFSAVREAFGVLEDGGRIITLGSVIGDRMPFPGMAAYGATKAAVRAATQGWSRDFAPRGITVNVVQPGPIDTQMNPADGEMASYQEAQTALGRYGKPEEVAAAVAFLCSPEASYLTGASLDAAGGFNA